MEYAEVWPIMSRQVERETIKRPRVRPGAAEEDGKETKRR